MGFYPDTLDVENKEILGSGAVRCPRPGRGAEPLVRGHVGDNLRSRELLIVRIPFFISSQ